MGSKPGAAIPRPLMRTLLLLRQTTGSAVPARTIPFTLRAGLQAHIGTEVTAPVLLLALSTTTATAVPVPATVEGLTRSVEPGPRIPAT